MSAEMVTKGVLAWGRENMDDNTIAQAEKTARLPFVVQPLALMPDAHVGIGATVGSVAFMAGAIVPSAVGVDIGCGCVARQTSLKASHLPDDLNPLLSLFEECIPAGVGQGHEDSQDLGLLGLPPSPVGPGEAKKIGCQFGTLGSGNHFVEVCLDENGNVWIVLHSGSRGIGNQLASRHIEKAKKLMRRYFIELDDPDLAYFAEHTPEFEDYVKDMFWAQEYAMMSRAKMMTAAFEALDQVVGGGTLVMQEINCHHNFAAREYHHGRPGWVIRKGAIRAREGDRGIIPGSMGTATYIVTGLGNPASYMSCSHGAGRRLSRSKARKELTVESFSEWMDNKFWQASEAKALLDEHPLSYKDIEAVMDAQTDLVRIDHRLTQILNYKGTR